MNVLTPELRAAYDRHLAREATEDDLLNMAIFEAHGAMHSLPPHCLPTDGGLPYNEDHANAASHRCLSFLRELYLVRLNGWDAALVAAEEVVQHAREEGETDYRQMLSGIRGLRRGK